MFTIPDDLRWSPDLARREVTMGRIEDVAFTPMPERLRNELITRAYGDLAQEMARLLGTGDATWAAFGQWASSTIGGYLTIDVPVLGALIRGAFGDGNRDVFADIGRAHATFLATVGRAHDSGGDLDEAWAQCQAELHRRLFSPPGGPEGGTAEQFWESTLDPRSRPDGRRYNLLLILGFRAYRNALTAPSAEQRSRHILAGNCLIGLHEQRLLALAISIGFRSWLRTVTTPWSLLWPRHRYLVHDPGRFRLWLEHRWIRFATGHLIGVALPPGPVKVGRPVPAGSRPVPVPPLPPGHPASARRILALDDDTILGSMFERFAVDGGRARCWNDLADRMAYIAALFAREQRAGYWFDANGTVVRPPPWPDLDTELSRQVALVGAPDPGPPAPDPGHPSPLSDAQLDQLRSRPSHLPLDGPGGGDGSGDRSDGNGPGDDKPGHPGGDDDLIDFGDVAGGDHDARFQSLRRDVEQRHQAVAGPGGLLGPGTCGEARRLFGRWAPVWFMGLVFRSLPDSYGAVVGAHVLGRVSDLATDPFRRAGETAQFVVDLLARDDGWDHGHMVASGSAFRSVLGVRAMHAIVATRLLADGWDAERLGPPLNQEDVLGAALAFGVPPVEMLDHLGFDLRPEARDAYVRFWLGIGHLLGAPIEALTVAGPGGQRVPFDYHQARAVALAIRRRHHARSLDGVRLAEAITGGVADGFPRGAGWLAPGLLQVLGDQRVTGLLLAGTGEGRAPAAAVAAVFRFAVGHRLTRPLGRWAVTVVGRAWVRPFLAQGRTRPYRRPPRAEDHDRLRVQDADRWPLSCSPAPSPGSRRPPRPGGRRWWPRSRWRLERWPRDPGDL